MTAYEDMTRHDIENIIVTRAYNDAAIWNGLIGPSAEPEKTVATILGTAVPHHIKINVHQELPHNFYHIIPNHEDIEEYWGPSQINPRHDFHDRLTGLITEDVKFKQDLLAASGTHTGAGPVVAKKLNMRFPPHVHVNVLEESVDTNGIYQYHLVLRYMPHNGLFTGPNAIRINHDAAGVDLQFNQSERVPFLNEGFTIETWVKIEEPIIQGKLVSLAGAAWPSGPNNPGYFSLGLYHSVDDNVTRVYLIYHIRDYSFALSSMKPLDLGKWYYLGARLQFKKLELLIDGQVVNSNDLGQAQCEILSVLASFAPGIWLGNPPTAANDADANKIVAQNYSVLLGESRLWRRLLTNAEMARNRPYKRPVIAHELSTLYFYYQMKAGQGTTLWDYSARNHRGLIRNAQWVTGEVDLLESDKA